MLGEFELINRYLATLPAGGRGVALGIGDDCALLEVPAGMQLAVSLDSFVEGVHFLADTPAEQLAQRCVAACVSDLAAMGTEPAWLTLGLTLPESSESWLSDFSRGLGLALQRYGLTLVGGDTTRGPLVLSLQAHGWVPQGQALTRTGARPGDAIWVSGSLGDAMAGLDQLQHSEQPDPYLVERFYRPTARIELGQALRGIASATLDISDGLLADLNHLLKPESLGAELELEALPLSKPLLNRYSQEQAQAWALSGGEDFELCFTVPAERSAEWQQRLGSLSISCHRVGTILAEPGILGLRSDAEPVALSVQGYRHF